MGRCSTVHISIAILGIAAIASGFAQLDLSDEIVLSSFGLRRLTSYYPRNFALKFPTTCYRSSYFSAFRIYFKGLNFDDSSRTIFVFQLDVSTCPFPRADCCIVWLDHMVIRTNASAHVLGVKLEGQSKDFAVGPEGLTIYRMRVQPNVIRSLTLEISTPAQGYNYPVDLCPNGRHPGSCDVVLYDESKTCCPERAALDHNLLFPSASIPPSSAGSTTSAPPSKPSLWRPSTPIPPPPLSPLPSSPPQPTTPSPPSPPPPPPDGWDMCCIDDVSKSPYILKFQGSKASGSDTAFLFQLLVTTEVTRGVDFDGPELGDCSTMGLRDLGMAIYDSLIIKNVQFNGTVTEYWLKPQASAPNSNWMYLDVMRPYSAFAKDDVIDLVITVRGKVHSLCPANDYLQSPTACEFAFHGKDDNTHCCPHAATKRAGPLEDCCVDDVSNAPYRMQYLRTYFSEASTVYHFGVEVVPVPNTANDIDDAAPCNHMSIESAHIQIYKNVQVLQVKWEDRFLDFNVTSASEYASWLNINNINRFVNDFASGVITRLTIAVGGTVRELCPADWLFGGDGAIMCEYVFHGWQGNQTCCPHDVTHAMSEPTDCGCRDDLPRSPYRLDYNLAAIGDYQTMFYFDLAKVNPSASMDKQFGEDAVCSDMVMKSIVFVVHQDVDVQDVIFNGFNYTWQFEPYTTTAKWLRILDLDYSPSDIPNGKAVPLQVVVNGNNTHELCSAASQFPSQASCEYIIYGGKGANQCCPSGVTSWHTTSISTR